jgi:hypothetical protein
MDPRRFDNWTRNRAANRSRRQFLRLPGIARPVPARFAQSGTACQLALRAELAGGPSAPVSWNGMLAFTLSSEGLLSDAFWSTERDSYPVSGVAVGHAVDLLIDLNNEERLVLVGVADPAIADCPASASGLVAGPLPGDVGAWEASAASGSSLPSSSDDQSGASGSSGATSGIDCESPQTRCGPSCCAALATCVDETTGLCSCPAGTEQCGNRCVPSCLPGQSLDLDTCLCPPLLPLGDPCAIDTDCDSGFCGNGICTVCNGLVCSGLGCIDPTRNSQNCGECGNTCVQPEICMGGFCFCSPEGAQCTFAVECCSKVCYNNMCAICSNISGNGAPLTQCGDGCADLGVNNYHCGFCFNQCINSRCLYGTCINTDIDPNNCGSYSLKCAANETCILGTCIITSQ